MLDDARVTALARAQDDVVTRAQALRLGLTSGALQHRVRAGHWSRPFHLVYVVPPVRDPVRTEARAAVLAAGGGAVCAGTLAARLHGIEVVRHARTELVVPRQVRLAGVSVRRRRLAPQDVTDLAGLPVTTETRTVLDLLDHPDRLTAVWAAEHAVRQRRVSRADLAAHAGAHPRTRRAERWQLVDERSESPLETATRLAILDAGLPRPQLQVLLRDELGVPVARVDLYFPAERVAVEADGRGPHDAPAALYRDRQRQNELQRLGVVVLRCTWWDVHANLAVFLSQLRTLLHAQRERLSRGLLPPAAGEHTTGGPALTYG